MTENDILRNIEVTIHTQDDNRHVSMILGKTFTNGLVVNLGAGIHPHVLPTLALIAIDQYTLDNHVSDYAELTRSSNARL